jgi:HEAT repeat protein
MYLFSSGTIEDRFVALGALGDLGSARTLECATTLMRDQAWRPSADGVVSCGTIAASLRDAEGQPAACALLLLMRDPRFRPADAAALREATRLWRQTDLRTYIDLADLSAPDPARREEMATFLGAVGLEGARAPLLRLLGNPNEPLNVRRAAAAALGGLRIARGDLAARLRALLAVPDEPLREGAISGLGRLKVRQAAAALVSMVGGPYEAEGRAALSRLTGLPKGTDWSRWLESCDLPEGT